jgi:hypothetical protein
MENSPNWKQILLNEGLPKFTSALNASETKEDLFEVKESALNFVMLINDTLFAGENKIKILDPQE